MGQATQVLLVDDNPMIRELLIHSLAPPGDRVRLRQRRRGAPTGRKTNP